MKRQLKFELQNDKYVITENGTVIFTIGGKDLKFESAKFYNGVYKDKTAAIELTYDVDNDSIKKGGYIYLWLSEIVSSIQAELNDPELEEVAEVVAFRKKVPLYELSACAGNGSYSSGPSDVGGEIESVYIDADYAVKISGNSMEPTIADNSIVFVQNVNELSDGDIGIFVVDGEVMCKRYRDDGEKKWLEPDNNSTVYKKIYFQGAGDGYIQGRVLLDD
jgi:phage repressor protein C with HTH and peptisase S24 domain